MNKRDELIIKLKGQKIWSKNPDREEVYNKAIDRCVEIVERYFKKWKKGA